MRSVRLAALALLCGFLLRTHNGTICIFDSDSGTLLADTGVSADRLPAADRSALERGLTFDAIPGLTGALEDYCS